jgi:Uncharacterized conserved protein
LLGATSGPNGEVIMNANTLTAVRPISTLQGSDFLSDVIAGLSSDPRTLPCKYFYDERGAALFQRICELPEYYITRTEIDILDRHRREIAAHLGTNIELIGLGTGAGTKTRILIEALEKPAVYIPVDISEKQLRESTALFREIFPDLEILPSARIICSLSCSPRRAAKLRVTLFIFRVRPLATSRRKTRSSSCGVLPIYAAVKADCSLASICGKIGMFLRLLTTTARA